MKQRDKLWTPGPWRKKEGGNLGNAIEAHCGQWQYGDYYSVVATYQDGLPYGNNASFEDERINMAANGQLISAAPDLVEALEKCMTALERMDSDHPYLADAYAAIYKAYGDSQ